MDNRYYAYGILVYYWGLIYLIGWDLPKILPDNLINPVCLIVLGSLLATWFYDDEEMQRLVAKSKSPRFMSTIGCFSWTGDYDSRDIFGTENYILYGNGINFNGWYERGNVAVVVPAEHCMRIGRNMIVTTELNEIRVPAGTVYDENVDAVFGGDSVTLQFFDAKDDYDRETELSRIKTEKACAVAVAHMYWQTNNDMLNMVKDQANVAMDINPLTIIHDSVQRLTSPEKKKSSLFSDEGDDD